MDRPHFPSGLWQCVEFIISVSHRPVALRGPFISGFSIPADVSVLFGIHVKFVRAVPERGVVEETEKGVSDDISPIVTGGCGWGMCV